MIWSVKDKCERARYPAIKAAMKPKITGKKLTSSAEPISLTCKINAPKIAGIDNIKLNLAANSLSKPILRPAAIVVPERERPGNTAHAWPNPINNASFLPTLLKLIFPLVILWDK